MVMMDVSSASVILLSVSPSANGGLDCEIVVVGDALGGRLGNCGSARVFVVELKSELFLISQCNFFDLRSIGFCVLASVRAVS